MEWGNRRLCENGIQATFHYQELHDSKFCKEYCNETQLFNAEIFTGFLVRLPLYYEIEDEEVRLIIEAVMEIY